MAFGNLQVTLCEIGGEKIILNGQDITNCVNEIKIHGRACHMPEIEVALLGQVIDGEISGNVRAALSLIGTDLDPVIWINGHKYIRASLAGEYGE
jgi:hypothetical protein